jgi:mono/diheme cytochrome c family protein
MPLWLIVLFAILFYWGQLYLDSNAAGFDPRVHEAFQSYVQLDGVQPKDETQMFLAKGKALFELRCGSCHQNTGLGTPGLVPPLAESEWVNTPGPGRIIRIASNGLTGPIEVKGQIWNSQMASGLTADLSSEEMAALVSYVRQSWGNNAPVVKPEQAKTIMDKVADRGFTPWTADELMAVPETE